MNLQAALQVSQTAARNAGALLLKYLGKVEVRKKGPRDLVTEADIQSQKLIQTTLLDQFPSHGFLGEEGDSSDTHSDSETCWIVDPLDGTTNFVHTLPGFAVSIGLRHRGEMVLGTIYDPVADECFYATRGGGAFLNGQPISVSSCKQLENSLLVCSFPSKVDRDGEDVQRFLNIMTKSTVRRMGSAAVNLAYVACGRLDGYWASSLKIWDMAAGFVIATEAGAKFTQFDGSELDWSHPQFLMTSTPELHALLLQEMQTNR